MGKLQLYKCDNPISTRRPVGPFVRPSRWPSLSRCIPLLYLLLTARGPNQYQEHYLPTQSQGKPQTAWDT